MIVLGFCLSLAYLALQTISPFCAKIPILAFVPFLALLNLLRPLSKALQWSCFAGFLIDILSYDPFGIHALNYTLSSLFCFRWRRRFSAEIPLQFGLYTAFFSSVSTVLQTLMLFLFDRRILFQGIWWITDWPLLPVCDALYALLWFTGPLALYRIACRTDATDEGSNFAVRHQCTKISVICGQIDRSCHILSFFADSI
jgi:rod shape-determining protein MreD